jgi:hypothetical protein
MTIASWLVASLESLDAIEFHRHAVQAHMVLANPGRKVTIVPGGPDAMPLEVKYVGPAGELVLQTTVSFAQARELAAGGRIPITYLPDKPFRVWLAGDKTPSAWGSLGTAVVTSLAFALAVAARLRERSEARRLGEKAP